LLKAGKDILEHKSSKRCLVETALVLTQGASRFELAAVGRDVNLCWIAAFDLTAELTLSRQAETEQIRIATLGFSTRDTGESL
jgi:hypothetical protein